MSTDPEPSVQPAPADEEAEIAAEQAVIDEAHHFLDLMIDRAKATSAIAERAVRDENTVDARITQWHLLRRERELVASSGPLAFGRIITEPSRVGSQAEDWYIGRRHVESPDGDPAVLDWRAPISAPFYRATGVDPCGLESRRRFSMDGRRVVALFDEDFTDPDAESRGGLPDPLLAELERSRSGQMRDIVATIAAEQDVIIRAELEDLLIVQGGPGTGKTAVGLHRAAFLLFQHRHHLEDSKVLVVGPNPVFLRYIADVLPSLGESAVVQATVPGLLAARYPVRAVDDTDVAVVKGDLRMVQVIERFLAAKLSVPDEGLELRAGIAKVRFSRDELAELQQRAVATDLPLNQSRDVFRRLIVEDGWRRHSARIGVDPGGQPSFAAAVNGDATFKKDVDRMWPNLSAPVVARELLGSKRKLATAAAGILDPDEVALLSRKPTSKLTDERWTEADLGLIDELVARVQGVPTTYGHVIVDEAQDHSGMSLRLLARRAERGSMTILGDLAQATAPVSLRSWDATAAILTEGTPATARVTELTVGYRVPSAILDLANRLLPGAAPDVTPTRSIRPGGTEPLIVSAEPEDLGSVLVDEIDTLLRGSDSLGPSSESLAVVAVADRLATLEVELASASRPVQRVTRGALPGSGAIALIDPDQAKGLEFDAVIVVEPREIAELDAGELRLYVAMTRAVQHLGIVHARPLPDALTG